MVAPVLSQRCRTTLTAARLAALPPALRGRKEVAALRYAVALGDGDPTAPGRLPYLNALASNLARLDRLDTLLAAASAAGLRLVPLKGALLLRTHYGDPGARPMVDLDIACLPDELPRAIELCRDLGYEQLDTPAFRLARDAVHDIKMLREGVTIELHHRLWHELRIARDVEPLIARATEVPFGAATAWAPSEADHLYVVMIHAATHAFVGNALWLTDAALLCAGADPSLWARVQAEAARSGARVALAAARDQLTAALPWLTLPTTDEARLRRALLRRLTPWLQRGEGAIGVWPTRLARPLMFDRARDLGSWALEKLAMMGRQRRPS